MRLPFDIAFGQILPPAPAPRGQKPLSESEICDKFIRPAMEAARWNGMDQIYREFPLRAGRVVVRGQKSFRDTTTVVPISALPLRSA